MSEMKKSSRNKRGRKRKRVSDTGPESDELSSSQKKQAKTHAKWEESTAEVDLPMSQAGKFIPTFGKSTLKKNEANIPKVTGSESKANSQPTIRCDIQSLQVMKLKVLVSNYLTDNKKFTGSEDSALQVTLSAVPDEEVPCVDNKEVALVGKNDSSQLNKIGKNQSNGTGKKEAVTAATTHHTDSEISATVNILQSTDEADTEEESKCENVKSHQKCMGEKPAGKGDSTLLASTDRTGLVAAKVDLPAVLVAEPDESLDVSNFDAEKLFLNFKNVEGQKNLAKDEATFRPNNGKGSEFKEEEIRCGIETFVNHEDQNRSNQLAASPQELHEGSKHAQVPAYLKEEISQQVRESQGKPASRAYSPFTVEKYNADHLFLPGTNLMKNLPGSEHAQGQENAENTDKSVSEPVPDGDTHDDPEPPVINQDESKTLKSTEGNTSSETNITSDDNISIGSAVTPVVANQNETNIQQSSENNFSGTRTGGEESHISANIITSSEDARENRDEKPTEKICDQQDSNSDTSCAKREKDVTHVLKGAMEEAKETLEQCAKDLQDSSVFVDDFIDCISDSQLCKLADSPAEGMRYNMRPHTPTDETETTDKRIKKVISDLSQLNAVLMRSWREMQRSRLQWQQNRAAPATTSAPPAWPSSSHGAYDHYQ